MANSTVTPMLKRRAWPIGVAFGATFLAGVIADVVGLSQILILGGGESLLILYPLSAVGMALPALLLTPKADRWARLPMLRRVGVAMAATYAVCLGMSLLPSAGWALAGAGMAWIVASVQNYLYPLLLWSLNADLFNVAESQRINGWIVSWSYLGRLLALALTTLTPLLLTALGVPLMWLLALTILLTAAIAVWLPHRLKGAGASEGLPGGEGMRESLISGWRFIHEVRVWRWLVNATLLTATAGAALVLGSSTVSSLLIGPNGAQLQMFIGGVQLVAALDALAVQRWGALPAFRLIGLRGVMLINPTVVVVAGGLLTLGIVTGSLVPLAVGLVVFRISEWTMDQNARSAALGFVPDQRRGRVALLLVLTIALAWTLTAMVAAPGMFTDARWLLGAAPAAVGLLGLGFWVVVFRRWDRSMLSWQLRRRKRRSIPEM